jgi:anti-sigma regulatory factor (Ser/Thr protein kinase)
MRQNFILTLLLAFSTLLYSQRKQEISEDEYVELVYKLCVNKPQKQSEIHKVLQPFQSDLPRMNVLLEEASNKRYGPGLIYARTAIGVQFMDLGLNEMAETYFKGAMKVFDSASDPQTWSKIKLYRTQINTRLSSSKRLEIFSALARGFDREKDGEKYLWAEATLSEAFSLLELDRSAEALLKLKTIARTIGEVEEYQEKLDLLELNIYMNQKRYQDASFKAYDLLRVENKLGLKSRLEVYDVLIDIEKYQGTEDLMQSYTAEYDSLQLLLADSSMGILGRTVKNYSYTMMKVRMQEQDDALAELKSKRNRTLVIGGILIMGLLAMVLLNVYRQYLSDNEKRVLSLEQRMLRSQMNPHFIFNSLNSIKQFIIVNEKEKAVRYLNKFAKLMRKILDGSGKRETSLAEELETVDLYLKIENMRFSNDIDINVQVDPSLNTELIKVPSLVLQPFLENAIWHGLSDKEGDKKIWIHIKREKDLQLRISITDNGIGRELAEERKTKRQHKRKSVGLTNTKERLSYFASNYQKDYEIEFYDLQEPDGQASGTQVVLKIPLV